MQYLFCYIFLEITELSARLPAWAISAMCEKYKDSFMKNT